MSLDLFSTIVGACISGTVSILIHFLNRSHERRIHENNVALQLAVEQLKRDQTTQELFAKIAAEGNQPAHIRDPHVDAIFLDMLGFMERLRKHRRIRHWESLWDWIRGECPCGGYCKEED